MLVLEGRVKDTNAIIHQKYKDADVHIRVMEVIDTRCSRVWRNDFEKHWHDKINNINYLVQSEYCKNFKICLEVVKVKAWEHDGGSIDSLLYDLKFVPQENTDVVVGLTSRSVGEILFTLLLNFTTETTLGLAEKNGNYMVVDINSYTGATQVFVHEMGHVFGAEHVDDENSIMYRTSVPNPYWDKDCRKIILANKHRSWKLGEEIEGLHDLVKKIDDVSAKQLKQLCKAIGDKDWKTVKAAELELVRKYPEEGHLYFLIGETAATEKDFDMAINAYEKSLQLGTPYATLQNNLSYMYLEKEKNVERALALSQQACAKRPKDDAFLDTLGWAYYHNKRYEDAEKELLKVSALSDVAEYHYHLAMTYDKLGKHEKAKSAFLKVMRFDTEGQLKKIAKEKLDMYNVHNRSYDRK